MNFTSEQIIGLGLPPRDLFFNRIKKWVVHFLDQISEKFPHPFNLGLRYLAKKIPFRGLSSVSPEELRTLVSFVENNLAQGRFFAVYSENQSGYGVVQQLKKTPIGNRLWAHYDSAHRSLDSFHRSLTWMNYYDAIFAPIDLLILITSPERYEPIVNTIKMIQAFSWKVVLPFYERRSFKIRDWVNPTPTLLWGMQFAGSDRLRYIFEYLAKYDQRLETPYGPPFAVKGWQYNSARALQNAKRDNPKIDPDPIRAHMGYTQHLYNEPNHEEIYQQLKRTLKSLPYTSWTYVHEFINMEKIQEIKDLQTVMIIRDPRDMLVSYFFRYNFDPRYYNASHYNYYWNESFAPLIQSFDMETFKEKTLLSLAQGGTFMTHPYSYLCWPSVKELASSFVAGLRSPCAFTIKLEDLRTQPKEICRELIRWLNWNPRRSIPEAEIDAAILRGTLDFQTGGKVKESEQQTNQSFFCPKTGIPMIKRTGKAGDWKNHFSEEIKAFIKKEIGEELIELGYEKDLNW